MGRPPRDRTPGIRGTACCAGQRRERPYQGESPSADLWLWGRRRWGWCCSDPLVGLGGLASILAITLRVLAIRYGVAWSPGAFAQFSGAVGGGALVWWTLRYGLRETLKIIPMVSSVAAGTLNAAAAFGVTVGIGEAACVWLGYRRRGLMAPDSEVRRAFADGLASGLKFARSQAIQRRENNE